MIELVEHEACLRTPNVHSTLVKLSTVSRTLNGHLEKMAAPKGRVQGFIWQLRAGRRHQEALEATMKELAHVKLDLGLHIQLANVGLTRGVQEKILVSVAAVDAVNRQLQEKLGSSHQLRISRLIEGRPRNDDGTVTLTKDDITFLSSPPQHENFVAPIQQEVITVPRTNTVRMIRGNEASQNALQVNTPIGQDLWDGVATVRVEDNRATGCASQLNYPTSIEAFLAVVQARSRDWRLGEQRELPGDEVIAN
ncbi:hypothetical protein B0I37DRAFT_386566 [Chaetomium sp. MPI-CAGE-AT-0009]|nr:hypothetical protein B0I37DRAFT_386566 [Chaetomium sp. MPI-CAGE-AT-0009]